MVHFMGDDVKPLEVVVHPLAIPEGRLLFEPLVIALREFLERLRAHVLQHAQVMVKPVSFDLVPRPVAKMNRHIPLGSLFSGQLANIERCRLIANFSGGDVQEERADRVAVPVMQVVEFVHTQTLDGLERGRSRVVHHRHEAADLRSKAGDLANQIEVAESHNEATCLRGRIVHHTVMPKTKVALTIDADLLEQVDALVSQQRFRNRSQAIEAALADKLHRLARTRLAREAAKLNPAQEKRLADEGLADALDSWPEY